MRYVLGIETSCDETAAAVVENGLTVRSNVIASQIETHRVYGGVVPEIASREHLAKLGRVVEQALTEAGIGFSDLDAIAVTRGPGLIGALLVGVSYAKGAAFSLGIPLVGIHHIEGHIYSVAFEHPPIEYPAIAFVVSGGHTNLFWLPEPFVYHRLGFTRDDAAGEAYDKVAKMLGLGYPGGPIIDRLAKTGHPDRARLAFRPPRIPEAPYDFSFSGLKTAVLRYVRDHGIEPATDPDAVAQPIRDLAAAFQSAAVATLLGALDRAIADYPPRTIVLGGGVACNSALRDALRRLAEKTGIPTYLPSPRYTTDNAAMIAAAGHARLCRGENHGIGFSTESTLPLHSSDLVARAMTARKRFRS